MKRVIVNLLRAMIIVLLPVTVWAAPNAPSGLTAMALSSTQIKLTWTDNSTDETSFKIERKIAGGAYSVIYTAAANATSYTNINLTQGTEYYYQVRAYNASGYSAFSNVDSATTLTLNAPTDLAVSSVSYTKATLTWTDNSGDESGFKIERKTGELGAYSVIYTTSANVTSYTNTGLTQGTDYYYQVRAYSGSNYSPFTNGVIATMPVLPPPSGLTATAISSTQIQLTWTDNSSDETRFYIEYKTTGNYIALTNLAANTTEYTHTNLAQGTTYSYRVKAYDSTNSAYSEYSNEAPATTLTLNAPTDLAVSSVSYTKATLTWTDNSDDETGFKVERKTGSGGAYSVIYTTAANATSYTNSNLTQGTEYRYQVRAYSGSNYSPFTNEVIATTPVLPPPSGLTATALSSTQIQLTWTDNSTDETKFYIEYKTTGNYVALINLAANTTTYTHNNLAQGTTYSYRVKAYDSTNSAYSAFSNDAPATTTTLNAPSDLSASASYTQVILTWTDNSSDESGFKIERKIGEGGAYSVIYTASANATSYTNAGLPQGTEYYYRVRAYSGSNYSEFSNVIRAATLTFNAPSDLAAAPLSSSQIKLTWTDNTTDETKFYIERKTGSGTYSQIAYVAADVATYTDTGLTQETAYYYRVRAYGSTGYSSFSNEAAATTLTVSAPSNLKASPLSDTQIKLTWTDNTPDETSFYIEYKTGGAVNFTALTSVTANTTTYTHTNLNADTAYYYHVRAYNAGGYSAFSNEVSAATPTCTQEGYYQP